MECGVSCPELRGTMASIRFPAVVDIKRDGEWTLLIRKYDGSCYMVNKYGTKREGDFVDKYGFHMPNDSVVAGELCYGEGRSGDLYKLLSNKDNDEALFFYPFDCLKIGGRNIVNEELMIRLGVLRSLNFERCCNLCIVDSVEEVNAIFNASIMLQWEGLVIKNTNGRYVHGPCDWYKMKRKDQTDYIVSKIDAYKERIEVIVPSPAGNRPCGVKVSNKDKATLTVGMKVTIEHQGVLDTGGLRHPVFKGVPNGKI
jgi:hypothetical protein